jgi:hypothetical protein
MSNAIESPMKADGALSSHPFIKPNADVILRSSDDVDFRVHKVILSLTSDFFEDMFSLPQNSSQSEIQRIPVAEDSHVLDALLRVIYPNLTVRFDSLHLATSAFTAAQKYQMQEAAARIAADWMVLAEKDPTRAYALACKHHWEDGARSAARFALRYPLFGPEVDEMDDISSRIYYRILCYHLDCQHAVSQMLKRYDWVPVNMPSFVSPRGADHSIEWSDEDAPWLICDRCQRGSTHRPGLGRSQNGFATAWWDNYITAAFMLLKETPWGERCMDRKLLYDALNKASKCEYDCSDIEVALSFEAFTAFLTSAVESEIDKVGYQVCILSPSFLLIT